MYIDTVREIKQWTNQRRNFINWSIAITVNKNFRTYTYTCKYWIFFYHAEDKINFFLGVDKGLRKKLVWSKKNCTWYSPICSILFQVSHLVHIEIELLYITICIRTSQCQERQLKFKSHENSSLLELSLLTH